MFSRCRALPREYEIRDHPSPEGRGCPQGRVRGAKILLFTPHPPLRVTLSLRERNLPQ
jgi:hypothetical protein